MRYLLLYNPVSGKAKFQQKLPYIIEYFKEKNLELDIFKSEQIGDLEKKAELETKNYDVYIVSGGDGSINEVLNGIMKTKVHPKLAIIPSGTANDTAAILGINKNLKKTLNLITGNKSIKMDINQLNDRYFIYATAAGLLTKVSYVIERQKVKKYGYFAYLFEGYKDIFNKYKMNLDIAYNDGVVSGDFMLVLGMSANRVGGFNLIRAKKTQLNDGKIEITLFKYTRVFRANKVLSFFIRKGRKAKEDITISSDYFNIKTTDDVAWNIDGEKSVSGSVIIKVLKQELEVFASQRAIDKFFTIK